MYGDVTRSVAIVWEGLRLFGGVGLLCGHVAAS